MIGRPSAVSPRSEYLITPTQTRQPRQSGRRVGCAQQDEDLNPSISVASRQHDNRIKAGTTGITAIAPAMITPVVHPTAPLGLTKSRRVAAMANAGCGRRGNEVRASHALSCRNRIAWPASRAWPPPPPLRVSSPPQPLQFRPQRLDLAIELLQPRSLVPPPAPPGPRVIALRIRHPAISPQALICRNNHAHSGVSAQITNTRPECSRTRRIIQNPLSI
jgi:hypothetical protein